MAKGSFRLKGYHIECKVKRNKGKSRSGGRRRRSKR